MKDLITDLLALCLMLTAWVALYVILVPLQN